MADIAQLANRHAIFPIIENASPAMLLKLEVAALRRHFAVVDVPLAGRTDSPPVSPAPFRLLPSLLFTCVALAGVAWMLAGCTVHTSNSQAMPNGLRAVPVADEYHGSLLLVQNGIHLASLESLTVTASISDTLPDPAGYSPNPAAVDAVVDPGSGRIYAIVNNGIPGSNNGNYLYVYEPETYQRILTDTERSVSYVAIDAQGGRAYVSRTHLAGQSTSLLADGRRYEARLDAAFGALRLDPDLGRLYLALSGDDEGQLLVLDAANLDVLGSVPIPGRFTIRSADPERHLLYLASHDGRVQIWSATGGQLPEPVSYTHLTLPTIYSV